MNIERLKAQIRTDEGIWFKPYKDIVGKLTIGYGRNLDDNGISLDEAEYMFDNDIQKAINNAGKAVNNFYKLSHARQEVIVNMVFNMGLAGFRTFKNTIKHIENNEFDLAADHMLKSKWAAQVGIRAIQLAKMMREG